MTAQPRKPRIACLPGDCIGPEVMAVATDVLRELAPDLDLEEHLFGAAAIRATGDSLPAEKWSVRTLKNSEAAAPGSA